MEVCAPRTRECIEVCQNTSTQVKPTADPNSTQGQPGQVQSCIMSFPHSLHRGRAFKSCSSFSCLGGEGEEGSNLTVGDLFFGFIGLALVAARRIEIQIDTFHSAVKARPEEIGRNGLRTDQCLQNWPNDWHEGWKSGVAGMNLSNPSACFKNLEFQQAPCNYRVGSKWFSTSSSTLKLGR